MSDVWDMLCNIKVEGFRLELLDYYHVDGEWEQFQKYLRGEPLDEDLEFETFCDLISEQISKGIQHIRVHVVPNKLTPYLRFEIETGYIPLSRLGVKILFIDREHYLGIINKMNDFYPIDCWLLDGKVVIELHYDDDNVYLDDSIITDNDIVSKYIKIRNILIDESTPFEDWNRISDKK